MISNLDTEERNILKVQFMTVEEIGNDLVDVFTKLYGLHMGQTMHISNILRPPTERQQRLDQQVYNQCTFQPKTSDTSNKLAQERYKKDKAAVKDQILQLNETRKKVMSSDRFST